MKFLRVLTILCAMLAMPLAAQAKLILADTGDTVEVVTASGVSTINVYAAWADITTTALTPGLTNSLITTATTTTVVAAPGASTQRQVKMLTVYNSHASSSNAISVQVYDGTNRAVLVKYTLLAGETLQWSEDENFRVIDASGQIKSVVAADTELPAAAALADNTANPTVPAVAAFLMCYDGSTWDRCQGGLTDTDDGTIAGAQVPGLMVPLNYVYDGTNWVRQRLTSGVEDAAETAGGGLTMMGSVRRDTAVASAGTAGDNATVNTDGLGRVWTREGNPCADYARITSASISESTAATNEIVSLTASNLIYVCSYKWVTTAANSLSWSYGTGTDCATGTTAIEGAQPFAANGGVAESGGGFPLFVVPSGNALCLVSSAATAHGGRISYVKTAAP